LGSLPGVLKSLEETTKVNERIASLFDRLEEGLRPLMAKASEREWNVRTVRLTDLRFCAKLAKKGI
jgi:hypothetical protein